MKWLLLLTILGCEQKPTPPVVNPTHKEYCVIGLHRYDEICCRHAFERAGYITQMEDCHWDNITRRKIEMLWNPTNVVLVEKADE